MAWIAGVDGCKAGWIAALADNERDAAPLLRVVPRLADLFDGPAPACARRGRHADRPARPGQRLRARPGTGACAPARASGSPRSSRSSRAARRRRRIIGRPAGLRCKLFEPPRKVSKQGFLPLPEDPRDRLRCCGRDRQLRERVFEVHPELAFRTMRGAPLATPQEDQGRRSIRLAWRSARRC